MTEYPDHNPQTGPPPAAQPGPPPGGPQEPPPPSGSAPPPPPSGSAPPLPPPGAPPPPGYQAGYQAGYEAARQPGPPASGHPAPGYPPYKRLTRTTGVEAPISGVCGGLAKYMGLDPTLVRVLAVIAMVVTFPVGPLVYVVLWAVIPKD